MGTGASSNAAAMAEEQRLKQEYRLQVTGASAPSFKRWKKQLQSNPVTYKVWRAELQARDDADTKQKADLEAAERERQLQVGRQQELQLARAAQDKKALEVKQAQDRSVLCERIDRCETAKFLQNMTEVRDIMRLHATLDATSASANDKLSHPSFGQALAMAMLDSEKVAAGAAESESKQGGRPETTKLAPLVDTLQLPRQIFEVVALVLYNRRRFALSHAVAFCSSESAFVAARHPFQTRIFDAAMAHDLAGEACWTIVKALIETHLDIAVSREVIRGTQTSAGQLVCALKCSWADRVGLVMGWRTSTKAHRATVFKHAPAPSAPSAPPPYDVEDAAAAAGASASASGAVLPSGGPMRATHDPISASVTGASEDSASLMRADVAAADDRQAERQEQRRQQPMALELCIDWWPGSAAQRHCKFYAQIVNDPVCDTTLLVQPWSAWTTIQNVLSGSAFVLALDPETLKAPRDLLHLRVARVFDHKDHGDNVEYIRVPVSLGDLERAGQVLVHGVVSTEDQDQYGHYLASHPSSATAQVSVRIRRKFRP